MDVTAVDGYWLSLICLINVKYSVILVLILITMPLMTLLFCCDFHQNEDTADRVPLYFATTVALK